VQYTENIFRQTYVIYLCRSDNCKSRLCPPSLGTCLFTTAFTGHNTTEKQQLPKLPSAAHYFVEKWTSMVKMTLRQKQHFKYTSSDRTQQKRWNSAPTIRR